MKQILENATLDKFRLWYIVSGKVLGPLIPSSEKDVAFPRRQSVLCFSLPPYQLKIFFFGEKMTHTE
jgi:hypothetical protein